MDDSEDLLSEDAELLELTLGLPPVMELEELIAEDICCSLGLGRCRELVVNTEIGDTTTKLPVGRMAVEDGSTFPYTASEVEDE